MHRFSRQGRGEAHEDSPNTPQAAPVRTPLTADPRRRWTWEFRDLAHARRDLSVLADRDRVVLAGPPGDTAVLSPDAVGRFGSALRAAAEQARK